MKNRKIFYLIICVLILLNIALALVFFEMKNNHKLKVVFFDVGQGDAILISEGSDQVLIDGGKNSAVLMERLGEAMPFWDRKIEMMIATHYDQDHIGGLIEVFNNYEVSLVVAPVNSGKTKVYETWKKALEEEKSEFIPAQKEIKLIFPGGAEGKVIHPVTENDSVKDTNDASVVLKLDYGINSFLFTGDLPDSKEQKLIQSGENLNAKILKVAHHGSKHSTISEFLEKVKPQVAVISVGADNSYGHPNQEVLDRLQKENIKILRTDEKGSIEIVCESKEELCKVFAE